MPYLTPENYTEAEDLRYLAVRRKSREWLKDHAIGLAHQARVKKKDLPFIYRLKEAILPAKPGESFGPTQESGKDRFLKRKDGTYFDRAKHKTLNDAAEEQRLAHFNDIYAATVPSSGALLAFKQLRLDALARLNVQNAAVDAQMNALAADLQYKRAVNKFLNRYNT